MIEFDIKEENREHEIPIASIKVVGVGGAGGNTINHMANSDSKGVDFVAVNTDAQALRLSNANETVQIGIKSTKGLGTGANPELGSRATEEDLDKIFSVLDGSDIVFLTGGMGGGTGSGGIPVLSKALKEKGVLTVAVVTRPFIFEGNRRAKVAEEAIEKLKESVDTLIVIPNQKLLEMTEQNISMVDAFAMINDVLSQSVKGISDIITSPGHINVDFADVKSIMKSTGLAIMGTSRASGKDRAQNAALGAISSSLLENMNIKGARGVLLNITGGSNLGLHEISSAASVIYNQVDSEANIILGSVIDDSMNEDVTVTVIATGFRSSQAESLVSKTPYAVKDPESEKVEMIEFASKDDSLKMNNVDENDSDRQMSSDIVDQDLLDIPTFLRNDSSKECEK